jgi:H+-transporting ATPase
MDIIKFTMRHFFEPAGNSLQEHHVPLSGGQSRRASAISGTASARYYANRTRSLKSLERPQNFGKRLLGMNKGMSTDVKEMRRFSSIQVMIIFEKKGY